MEEDENNYKDRRKKEAGNASMGKWVSKRMSKWVNEKNGWMIREKKR